MHLVFGPLRGEGGLTEIKSNLLISILSYLLIFIYFDVPHLASQILSRNFLCVRTPRNGVEVSHLYSKLVDMAGGGWGHQNADMS